MSFYSGKLTINILRANLTRDVCSFGSMDPSCTLRLSLNKVYNSAVKSNEGKYPIWNEVAVFNVENEITLKIEVNHQKEIIGGAEINLTNIYSLGKVDETDYKLSFNNSETGKIRLKFVFEPNNKNIGMNTFQGNTNSLQQPNFGYNNPNLGGNSQGYNQGIGNNFGYNPGYGVNNQGSGYNNQGFGVGPAPITYNQSTNPYGNNPYLTGNPLNLGNSSQTTSTSFGYSVNNNTGYQGTSIGGYDGKESNSGFSGVQLGYKPVNQSNLTSNTGFTGGLYGVNPGYVGVNNQGFSNQSNLTSNTGFTGGQYGVNPGYVGVNNQGFSNQTNLTSNTGFTGGPYGGTSGYVGVNNQGFTNQSNTGFTGGQYGGTPGFVGVNNQGFSNQGNLVDYQKSIWWKNLNYFKNPVFFRNNSSSAYFFKYDCEIWENITNFSGTFFPQFHRLTELPDSSFLMTGGEVNGVTISNTKHFFQGNFLDKPNMHQPRKAHGTAYLKGYVYVFGGYTDNGIIMNTCERFDMNNSNWIKIANMNHTRGYATTCVFNENLIYIVGGFSSYQIDGAFELNRIERYNSLTNLFEELNVRLQVPVYGCFVVPVNETKILIGGGFNTNTQNSNLVYTIDISNGSINYLPPMTNPGWTVLSPIYLNGALHIFSCGEESDEDFPEHITYPLKLPII